jgi:hypothetical protein
VLEGVPESELEESGLVAGATDKNTLNGRRSMVRVEGTCSSIV